MSRHINRPETLFLLLVLLLPSSQVIAGETLGDFIAKKLREMRIIGEKPESTRPTRGRSATSITINGHPMRNVIAGRSTHATAVPLPRPRPFATRQQAGNENLHPAATLPVTMDSAGRVLVKPEGLAQERDHYRAVYLKPREAGHWDAATVGRARRNCRIVLATLNVDASPISPIGGPQGCGIAAPVLVRSLGLADLKPDAKLNCRFTAALYEWVRNVVQPAARRRFGQPVVAIRQLSHYACRRRGGITRGPVRISEHSFGNAIDIGSFTLADGKTISVLKDWGDFSALFNRKAAFLKEVRDGACRYFSTVLSPNYNRAHRNHFHFDLGRGGRYRICK